MTLYRDIIKHIDSGKIEGGVVAKRYFSSRVWPSPRPCSSTRRIPFRCLSSMPWKLWGSTTTRMTPPLLIPLPIFPFLITREQGMFPNKQKYWNTELPNIINTSHCGSHIRWRVHYFPFIDITTSALSRLFLNGISFRDYRSRRLISKNHRYFREVETLRNILPMNSLSNLYHTESDGCDLWHVNTRITT